MFDWEHWFILLLGAFSSIVAGVFAALNSRLKDLANTMTEQSKTLVRLETNQKANHDRRLALRTDVSELQKDVQSLQIKLAKLKEK